MKLLLVLALLIIAASPVFAFTSDVPEGTTFVSIGSSKEIDIPIYSNIAEDISVTVVDAKPWLTQSDTIMHVEPGVGKVLTLYASPFVGTQTGVPFRFTLVATSLKTGEEHRSYIYVSVSRLDSVIVDRLAVSGNYTPTGSITINTAIKNYKETSVQNVDVTTKISSPTSDVVEFEQPIDTIDSGESNNITYNFMIPRFSEAGLYTIVTTATAGGETSEKTATFMVSPDAIFTTQISKQPNFFGFKKIITVTNIGNQANNSVVTEKLSAIDAAFYSGEEPVSRENNNFAWLLRNVKPGESRVFVYNINFAPVILLAGVIIVVAWIYFFHLRTLRIKKFIIEKKFIELGEEFTVGIEAINTSGKKIESTEIRDFVPSVFEVKDTEGPKPIRKKLAAGTELTWHLKDLHKNEERILTYKIIPMFGIHGTIRLPRASIKWRDGKKETEKRSFYASIGIDMDSYKDKREKK